MPAPQTPAHVLDNGKYPYNPTWQQPFVPCKSYVNAWKTANGIDTKEPTPAPFPVGSQTPGQMLEKGKRVYNNPLQQPFVPSFAYVDTRKDANGLDETKKEEEEKEEREGDGGEEKEGEDWGREEWVGSAYTAGRLRQPISSSDVGRMREEVRRFPGGFTRAPPARGGRRSGHASQVSVHREVVRSEGGGARLYTGGVIASRRRDVMEEEVEQVERARRSEAGVDLRSVAVGEEASDGFEMSGGAGGYTEAADEAQAWGTERHHDIDEVEAAWEAGARSRYRAPLWEFAPEEDVEVDADVDVQLRHACGCC